MGDVAGKGLAAASMVGMLRSAMRAYTLEGHAPADVVDRLNQLVWSEIENGHMTTLIYLVLDPLEGRIYWVNAGHLPPLAVTADGMAHFLDGPSTVPLGVMSHPSYETAEAEMPHGGSVLLYTDGLVERPGEVLDIGLDRLSAALRGERGGPQELCDRVLEALVPEGGASDDVALLALRNPPLTDSFQLELGSEPGELAAMRTLMRRWLRHGEGDERDIAEILTATGEAAANAIEHGGSISGGPPFEVSGRLDGDEVEIVVRDSGGWRERRREEGGRGLVLMRALMDSVEVDPDRDGTTVRMRRRLAGQPVSVRLPP
jgi:anti-sigma regulatory factor (Ser/Thr protein kinase)